MPVTFAIDRAGIVGEDGETHQGIFDISYLNQIPKMNILAPKSLGDLPIMLKWALNSNMPVAIRYPRGGDILKDIKPLTEIKYGKWEKIINGEKIAIIAVGKMVQHAILAKKILEKNGINPLIISATFVKPQDTELLKELVDNKYNIVTIEDNIISGGFGNSVLMNLVELGFENKFKALGFKDDFITHGEVNILYKEAKLDGDGIAETIIELQR